MIDFILILLSVPIYALCVVFLIAISPLCGGYVNASVYLCEYCQPVVTILLSGLFLFLNVRFLSQAMSGREYLATILLAVCFLVLCWVIYFCGRQFLTRLHDYVGMDNYQIFNYVVNKLQAMGKGIPGMIKFGQHEIAKGYIVANIVVYILPLIVTLLVGWWQRMIYRYFL